MAWLNCFPFFKKFDRKKVKRSSVAIPYQDFSLPFPIIRYLCSSENLLFQLKLFSTCQQLKNRIMRNKVKFTEIVLLKELQYIWKSRSRYLSVNDRHYEHSYLCCKKKKREKFKLLQSNKIENLKVNLTFSSYNDDLIYPLLQILNMNELKIFDLYISNFEKVLDIGRLRPIIVPSLTELLLWHFIKLNNGDFLTIALTELPNLKKLRMRWQDGITNLSTAALIPRTTKLDWLYLSWIKGPLTPENISTFIIYQMSNSCLIDFYIYNNGTSIHPCKCNEQKINDKISKSLDNAKFTFNVLFTCNHS